MGGGAQSLSVVPSKTSRLRPELRSSVIESQRRTEVRSGASIFSCGTDAASALGGTDYASASHIQSSRNGPIFRVGNELNLGQTGDPHKGNLESCRFHLKRRIETHT